MPLLETDLAVLRLMRTHGHDPRAERMLGALSHLGEHAAGWLALGTAGTLLTRDATRRRAWRRGVQVVAASYALNYAVKVCVRRPRPVLPDLPQLTSTVSGLSFPSAHTTTSFAAARAYRTVVPPAALYGVAGVMAVSRPYLGVHYPSDVLAGIALGTLVAEVWPR